MPIVVAGWRVALTEGFRSGAFRLRLLQMTPQPSMDAGLFGAL
jgi:hypothetical protein